jgi:hypothetical protein
VVDETEISLVGVTGRKTELPPPKALLLLSPPPNGDLTACSLPPPLAHAGFESLLALVLPRAAANPVGPPCAKAPKPPEVVLVPTPPLDDESVLSKFGLPKEDDA